MTPMMHQYLAIKMAHKKDLLFYRLGDFYELFFNDAKIGAKILDITLTKRGKHEEKDIPMCGIPYHTAANYIKKLIKHGYNVAICEQIKDFKENINKSQTIIKREVVRVITPGTLIEENLLHPRESNYLMSIADIMKNYAIAWIDISTGDIFTMQINCTELISYISKFQPKEILLSKKNANQLNFTKFLKEQDIAITIQSDDTFNYKNCCKYIKEY